MYIKWQVYVCTYILQWAFIKALRIYIKFTSTFICVPHALRKHVIKMQCNFTINTEYACTCHVNNLTINIKPYKMHRYIITVFCMYRKYKYSYSHLNLLTQHEHITKRQNLEFRTTQIPYILICTGSACRFFVAIPTTHCMHTLCMQNKCYWLACRYQFKHLYKSLILSKRIHIRNVHKDDKFYIQ